MKKPAIDPPVLAPAPLSEQSKRRASPGPAATEPRGVVTDFGTRPPGTTHFRCRRVADDGTKSVLVAPNAEGSMSIQRFPIEHLTAEGIRAQWGPGTYQVEFLGPRKGKGTCAHLSWGELVTLADGAARAAVPSAVEAPRAPAPDPLALMVQMRQAAREESEHIETRVNAQITGIAQLAAVLAGNHQAAQVVAAQQAQSQVAQALQAVAATLGTLETRLAALEGGADDEDEDDEGEEEDDEEEDDEEAPELDPIEKGMKLLEKHGPLIMAALEMLKQKATEAPAMNGISAPPATEPATPAANAVRAT